MFDWMVLLAPPGNFFLFLQAIHDAEEVLAKAKQQEEETREKLSNVSRKTINRQIQEVRGIAKNETIRD